MLIGIPLSLPFEIMILERKEVIVTSQGNGEAEELPVPRSEPELLAVSWSAQPCLLCLGQLWKAPFSLSWFHNLQLGNCSSHGLQGLEKNLLQVPGMRGCTDCWSLAPCPGPGEGRAASLGCVTAEPQHSQVLYCCYSALKIV